MRARAAATARARTAAVAIAIFGATACAHAQKEPATVILVRHVERADTPKADPHISAIGTARADELREVLRSAGVNVIYSTPKLRNLETARIIANALQVPIIEVPIDGSKIEAYAMDIVSRVKRSGAGQVSVVVGHSNTFGPVIRAFGGPQIEEIVDSRYDDLFILTVRDGKPLRMIRGKYGKRFSATP